jgi:hypothetical protein
MSLTEAEVHPYLLPPKSPLSPENGPLPPKKSLQTRISLRQSEEIPIVVYLIAVVKHPIGLDVALHPHC